MIALLIHFLAFSAQSPVFTLSKENFRDVIQRAAFAGGTNCTESHLLQNCSPGGKVADGVCVFASLGLFFNKSVCQQENSIDQRNIGSIVQKFFGTKFPKFAWWELLRVLWRDERAGRQAIHLAQARKCRQMVAGAAEQQSTWPYLHKGWNFYWKTFAPAIKFRQCCRCPTQIKAVPRQSAVAERDTQWELFAPCGCCRWQAASKRERWLDLISYSVWTRT